MHIINTKSVHIFCEVMGLKQDLIQKHVTNFVKTYLSEIHNCTTNSINGTMADVLTHLQDKCDQLMPQELLEHEYTVKNTIYHPHDPITSVFSIIEELI